MLAYNTAFTFTNSSESNQLVVCCIVLSNSPSLFLFTSLCHTASQLGVLANNTAFIFTNSGSNPIKVTGQKGFSNTQLFKTKKMNFEQLGIGGLDKQFEAIFRRAFASRVFPPSIVQKLGIKHVKVRST